MFLLLPSGSWALSGGAVKSEVQEGSEEAAVLKLLEVTTKIKDIAPSVSADDALRIGKLFESIQEDEQSIILIENMKRTDFSSDPALKNFIDSASPKEIVEGLNQILDELKAMDYLFQDPKRAVEEILKEGMIEDASRLELYRENPAQLEEDMRSGLYFSFVSFAVAGGFL